MRAIAAFTVLVLALVLALIVAAGFNADNAARLEVARAQGEAAIIRAQGQAAIDRADAAATRTQAAAVAMLAAVPWGALACLGVLGVGVLALAFAAVVSRPRVITTPPQIIERTVVYLPPPGQSRRETWQAITAHGSAEPLFLTGSAREVKR